MRERERERERYLISFSCQFLILNNLLKEPLVPAIDTAAQCAGWENKRECVCVCVCVCVCSDWFWTFIRSLCRPAKFDERGVCWSVFPNSREVKQLDDERRSEILK